MRSLWTASIRWNIIDMIDRILVENFKSFRKLDISLGRANLLIGENGSGKSNFLEVFRVLRGLSRSLSVKDVFDGKPPNEDFTGWPGIRGASAGACFAHGDSHDEVVIEARGTSEQPSSEKWEYLVKFSPKTGSLLRERLVLDSTLRYDSAPHSLESHPPEHTDQLDSDLLIRDTGVESILAQARLDKAGARPGSMFQASPSDHRGSGDAIKRASRIAKLVEGVASGLADILPLDPSPAILRKYSRPGFVRRIGDHGEGFAALVQSICCSAEYKDSLLWWLQQLLSDQVEDVGTTRGSTGELMFVLRDQCGSVPATVLSDGTLRFAALLAALLQPDKPSMITLDPVETAVHANRIRLLYLLLWGEAEYHQIQSISTTHSPVMLEWMGEDELDTTFVCKRDHVTGESQITPLPDVPHFLDAFKRGSRNSDMLTESWFEGVL